MFQKLAFSLVMALAGEGFAATDFSGAVGPAQGGFVVGGLGAFQVAEGFLETSPHHLSVESGFGFYSQSEIGIRIPLWSRLVFDVPRSRIAIGPIVGASFVTKPGGFLGQVGGVGFYSLDKHFSLRITGLVGGLSECTIGATRFF